MIEVARVADQRELEQALELRRAVFVGEQGVSPAAEQDGRDFEGVHLVARERGRVVGTCRLLLAPPVDRRGRPEVRLGRLAVGPAWRRRGVASALLAAAEREARAAGAQRIVLHAQTYACALYLDAGYRRRGRPFLEEGIEHVTMERPLG